MFRVYMYKANSLSVNKELANEMSVSCVLLCHVAREHACQHVQ